MVILPRLFIVNAVELSLALPVLVKTHTLIFWWLGIECIKCISVFVCKQHLAQF